MRRAADRGARRAPKAGRLGAVTPSPGLRPATALAIVLAVAGPAAGSELERLLDSRWRGAWVLLTTEVYSDCDAGYTNNRVEAGRVTSKGGRRLAPGEPARVHKIDARRAGIDLLVDLAEPLLLSWREGPFTLYEEAGCKVELKMDLPRAAVRGADVEAAEKALDGLLERHESLEAAEASPLWNRRRREPFPPDYEATLAAYEAWRASRVNAEVQKAIEEALDEASRLAARVEDDEEYALGFVTGMERMSDASFGDCPQLLSGGFYGKRHSPPGERSKAWKEGYEEGQRLVYHLEVARRLQRCFVPLPLPVPGG